MKPGRPRTEHAGRTSPIQEILPFRTGPAPFGPRQPSSRPFRDVGAPSAPVQREERGAGQARQPHDQEEEERRDDRVRLPTSPTCTSSRPLASSGGGPCAVGSANLDVTASYWESELLLLVEDDSIARAFGARVGELIAGSVRVDREDPAWQRLASRREWLRRWPGVLSV